MVLEWLESSLLWISLSLLLASALARKSNLAVLGWGIFAFFWLGQIDHYLTIDDYFNAVLFFAAGLLSFYMAWIMAKRGFSANSYYWASYAASACGLIYFPFAEVQILQEDLIGITTLITAKTLQFFSVPVTLDAWNIISLNGHSVQIILACTAIESIALFAGLILSVQAPLSRRLKALAASTASIYILNIIRNGFVLMAYGWSWFGEGSFDIAHNVIAKLGSTIALLAISYLVFLLLPELLSTIDELAAEIKPKRGDAA
ncbi:MAG TPA: archaeosortase A [Methanothrix sp.]|nr:archaeosortase A [Methanothrix sp.]